MPRNNTFRVVWYTKSGGRLEWSSKPGGKASPSGRELADALRRVVKQLETGLDAEDKTNART